MTIWRRIIPLNISFDYFDNIKCRAHGSDETKKPISLSFSQISRDKNNFVFSTINIYIKEDMNIYLVFLCSGKIVSLHCCYHLIISYLTTPTVLRWFCTFQKWPQSQSILLWEISCPFTVLSDFAIPILFLCYDRERVRIYKSGTSKKHWDFNPKKNISWN